MTLSALKTEAARSDAPGRPNRARPQSRLQASLPDVVEALEAADEIRAQIDAAGRWCDLPRGECFCAMNRYDQARARMEER